MQVSKLLSSAGGGGEGIVTGLVAAGHVAISLAVV